MKKIIVTFALIMFVILMVSTVSATNGMIIANGGDAHSKSSGNIIIREKNGFWIEMYSGSIRVNFRKHPAPCKLEMDSFTGWCMIIPLKGTTIVSIFGFGKNIQVS
jgi:hypothetical protein